MGEIKSKTKTQLDSPTSAEKAASLALRKARRELKQSGPFHVDSVSQDAYGLRLVVYPAFPEYDYTGTGKDADPMWVKEPHWVAHRLKGEGGGPSLLMAMRVAKTLENVLNYPYSPAAVADWKARLMVALSPIEAKQKAAFERHMKRLEKKRNART